MPASDSATSLASSARSCSLLVSDLSTASMAGVASACTSGGRREGGGRGGSGIEDLLKAVPTCMANAIVRLSGHYKRVHYREGVPVFFRQWLEFHVSSSKQVIILRILNRATYILHVCTIFSTSTVNT